jgi:hypothetical protein
MDDVAFLLLTQIDGDPVLIGVHAISSILPHGEGGTTISFSEAGRVGLGYMRVREGYHAIEQALSQRGKVVLVSPPR